MKDGRGMYKVKIGKKNRAEIKAYIEAHPDCIKKDICDALGISRTALNKHLEAIEKEATA